MKIVAQKTSQELATQKPKRFGRETIGFTLLILITLLLVSKPLVAQQQNHSSLTFEGVVTDSAGAPIAEAHVSIASAGRVLATTNTDINGVFQIQTEGQRDLRLLVKSPGFATHELQLSSLSQSALRVTLSPASISAQVIVAAARIPTPQGETAASVAVLDTKDLQATAAITLDDALRQVPGFSLFRRSGSRTANPTTQGVSLRGIGASGASRALVLADGIPLNDPFGGWVYWNRIPRESISKVEVLLGGASHLYGSAALAGLIEVVTKPVSKNQLSLSASYGNERTPNASIHMSGTKGEWSASVAGEIFRTDGYVLVPTSQRGFVDTPAGSRHAVLNLRLQRTFGQNHRFFGTTTFFGEARRNGTPLQVNRTHLRQFAIGVDIATATAGSFAARAYGGTQVFDQNFSAISADRNSETLTRVQRVPAQTVGASVQWSKVIGIRQTFVAGAETREVRGASDEIVFVNGQASSLVGSGGREHTSGIYFEDLIHVGRLFLNLGARLDHWRNLAALSATRPVTSPFATSVTQFPDRSESALSGQASAVYKVNDRFSAVASLLRAFRAPTLNELYRSFRVGNVITLANESLRAERLTGGEAGLRMNAFTNRLSLRGNVFWNEITRPVANVTLQITPALITRQRQNLGRTRSRGFELHSEATFNQHWSLAAGYLLADASVVRFPANAALEGLRIPQVARHQFTFQTRYSNPMVLTIGLQGRAASSQFDDDQNVFQLAPYFTLDTFVARRLTNRLEIFCAIENILNQRYEVGKTPVTTVGPPLLVRGGFRLQLGQR